MMNMLIKLDEERVKKDGKYDLAELWKDIDALFESGCTKQVQPDGSVMYLGDTAKDYFTCISIAYIKLCASEWFARYCSRWIWYYNDDDENLPFADEDVLAKERRRNPLFAGK